VEEWGLVEFDDDRKQFQKVVQFDMAAPLYPNGHPFLRTVDGVDYVYFASPFPLVRVRATPEALRRQADYEAFTCVEEGSKPDEGKVERAGGRPGCGWETDTGPRGPAEQREVDKTG